MAGILPVGTGQFSGKSRKALILCGLLSVNIYLVSRRVELMVNLGDPRHGLPTAFLFGGVERQTRKQADCSL
jgi:hypothetical protein